MEPFQMDNGKWAYNFMYQGKRYRKQGIRTHKEAKSRIRNILNDLVIGVDSNDVTLLADYFEKWLEVNKQNTVSEKSYDRFLSVLKKVKRYFPEDTRLKDLDQIKYQEFINHYASDLTKNSVIKIHQPLYSCFEDAVYNGLIKRNPAYNAKIWGGVGPKDEKYKYMTLTEYNNMKRFLMNESSPSALLLFILHITGARFSEINQLKYNYLKPQNKTGNLYLLGTKNDTSERTITIAPSDMQYIIEEIERLQLDKDSVLFNISHNAALKMFTKAKDALNVKNKAHITMHALRHTHCSYLLSKGVSIEYIGKRLGHASIATTISTYAHLLEETHEEQEKLAVNIMENQTEQLR